MIKFWFPSFNLFFSYTDFYSRMICYFNSLMCFDSFWLSSIATLCISDNYSFYCYFTFSYSLISLKSFAIVIINFWFLDISLSCCESFVYITFIFFFGSLYLREEWSIGRVDWCFIIFIGKLLIIRSIKNC